ncbi:hypothetical protein GLOTRDRAFT_71596 [Gloeophyllum trabeum ATCC 11539]|uniref:G-patch domain-containing protein n=1 Tax=Gloeophyllum trabeum (strain ATCC 11539 / FP-39264 / Madison 617) TaxID=670483 RepID=S7RSU0_GLOTA|nr:uncharacterized protein GLOTRDRAFT_71596 [Gloeophyllum trabeum ATCC 11539]EPQ57745.1 hypothetical protein GLOTRDRAFT_71596 [Gloeophyllum trabeum ATCC 11539]
MSAAGSKVSFTVRRPTPISRNSSEADSDAPSFKIPALPRHLADRDAPGSPLARSANSSPTPKRMYRDRDDSSDDDDAQPVDELVTGFDQFGVQRLHEKKKEGPLVIPALKNRDWREAARKRKAGIYVPPGAQAETGADGSVGGLGTRDSINSGPERIGLQFKAKKIKIEDGMDGVQTTEVTTEVDVKMEEEEVKKEGESEDQRALRALLAEVKGEGSGDGPVIEAIRPISEEEAYRQDVAELPDVASMEAYERVPVSQFGAAMLRGMGWKEGQAASRKQKGPVEPWLPQSRPALLGIGAKEREVLDDGSGKKKRVGKGAAMKYVPVIKKEREGSGSGSGSGRASPEGQVARRSPGRDRDDGRRDRDRDRDYDRDRRDRRRYDDDRRRDRDGDYERSDRRDRDDDRRRESRRDRDYDRSDRDRNRDEDRRRRRD